MSTTDKLATELADDCMTAMELTGNDRLYVEVGKVLGASSQTLEEAFLTEMRVRLAAIGAQKFLKAQLAQARATQTAAAPTAEQANRAD